MCICIYIYIYIYIYEGARSRLISGTNRRYFTLDFNTQVFFYDAMLYYIILYYTILYYTILDSLWGSSGKIGTMQRRLAWALRKDDALIEKCKHPGLLLLPLGGHQAGAHTSLSLYIYIYIHTHSKTSASKLINTNTINNKQHNK